MSFPLSFKETLLTFGVSMITAASLPFVVVPLLVSTSSDASPSVTPQSPPDERSMIASCQKKIAKSTQQNTGRIRIDHRSTGFRDQRFNVHGLVKQPEGEFDFQCWFKADRSFETHMIGRVNLKQVGNSSSITRTSIF